jgi:SAM-dependent methyltransferase
MSGELWDALDARPSVMPWRALHARFVDAVSREFANWIAPDQPHHHEQLGVAAGRLEEGARLLADFSMTEERVRVLDIGAGNGGIAFAFANDPRHEVHTLDVVANPQMLALRRALPLRVNQMIGDGAVLPFADQSLDLVLLVDVLEHLPRPRKTGAEIMRVLRPGGRCIVATPARAAWLFRRDPHYGVPGLVLFPNDVQRFIVDRLLRRRVATAVGRDASAYDVTHIYWHVREVTRLFPGRKEVDVLYDHDLTPPGRFTLRWFRHPRWFLRDLEYRLRWWLYGHIIIHKERAEAEARRYDRM